MLNFDMTNSIFAHIFI